jgi:glycolate oxidase FAD binding subunit
MTTNDFKSVYNAMSQTIGPSYIKSDTSGYSIDGIAPKIVISPSDTGQLCKIVNTAWEENIAITPWGGGTHINLGNTIKRLDVVINLTNLDRIIQHNPNDLTITVEAGIKISQLQNVLAQHGQFLAIDPPLPNQASIGGTLSAGVSGPLKWQFINPRDLVIGMKVVQPNGENTKSGGQVVKNVSGYDMARLHIGGLGTLGIISEISFKLTPTPPQNTTLIASFTSNKTCLNAALDIFHSQVVPLALTSFNENFIKHTSALDIEGQNFLAIKLGGRPRTVNRQVKDCEHLCKKHDAKTIESLNQPDATTVWRHLTDFGWNKTTQPFIYGRASLLPSKITETITYLEQTSGIKPTIISHPGYGTVLISWFVNPNEISDEKAIGIIHSARNTIRNAGGHIIIEHCPLTIKSGFDVWDDVGKSLSTMLKMKEQYDPKGILNPGRFVGGI